MSMRTEAQKRADKNYRKKQKRYTISFTFGNQDEGLTLKKKIEGFNIPKTEFLRLSVGTLEGLKDGTLKIVENKK